MEEGDDGTTTSEKSSLITTKMVKLHLEFAKNVKVVVVIFSVVISLFIVLYMVSHNHFFLGFSTSINNNATSSNHVLDHKYNSLNKALKAAATENRTVILTTLNDAWAEPNNIFDLFLESFKNGNDTVRLLDHLLVIAVDEKAYLRCKELVSHCYLFKSDKSSEMAHEARFMTPIYVEMMWERLALLHTVLRLGYNFVFTDTDVMWFRDPFPHFYPDTDFQTSCDWYNKKPEGLKNQPNNGFNFVRSNKRSIKFYKFWVSSRKNYPKLNEQEVFNRIKYNRYIKKIGLRFKFLDTDFFGGFCSPSKDMNKVCTMHANCCVGLDRKIADLNTTLDDWKRYTSLPLNQTTSFRWRVPQKCHM